MATTRATIPGIHCNSCAMLIKDISSDFPQIQNVDVDIEGKTVTLTHADDLDLGTWQDEISTLGEQYEVTEISKL